MTVAAPRIAQFLGVSETELMQKALRSLLLEPNRAVSRPAWKSWRAIAQPTSRSWSEKSAKAQSPNILDGKT